MTRHRLPIVLTVIAYLALLLPAPSGQACINDRDTLRRQGVQDLIRSIEGNQALVWAIVGRFEREPTAYYQMRIERSSKELQEDPTRLDLYDDIAAAHDRIGKSGAAIDWMNRKQAQLDQVEAFNKIDTDEQLREHVYRYHANLGTFYAHRWLRNGADRQDLADMQTGHEHIAKAIEIKPDAHFNRERFQLDAMKWILDMPAATDASGQVAASSVQEMATFLNVGAEGPEQAVEGLVGLIVMGNAWESVDVFYALAVALRLSAPSELATLALLRCFELIDAGGESLHPNMPRGEELKELMSTSLHVDWIVDRMRSDPNHYLTTWYGSARDHAETWQEWRSQFMAGQFDQGLHPDTDKDAFWQGYVEVAAQPLPVLSPLPVLPALPAKNGDTTNSIVRIASATVIVVALALLVIILVRRRARRRRIEVAARVEGG
jgi:tetratricopeptide (TPR) repeat protein